jgi:nitronate monooxygenase
LTRPMRNAAGLKGVPDFISLWAGQGVARSRALPAAALVKTLVDESSVVEVARP